jgi:hypothetical protein
METKTAAELVALVVEKSGSIRNTTISPASQSRGEYRKPHTVQIGASSGL